MYAELARLKQNWRLVKLVVPWLLSLALLSLALFSLENEAEKMFASMTEKDGGTYGAMIQGLAKVG